MAAPQRWFVEHTQLVAAPLAAVWAVLVDKVSRPERFVPNVERVEIVHDGGLEAGGVERKMWPTGAPVPIHEIIRGERSGNNRGVVDFVSLGHPLIHGYVLNTVEAVDGASCRLTFTMRWTRRGDAPPDARLPFADAQAAITKAVQLTAAAAEAASCGAGSA